MKNDMSPQTNSSSSPTITPARLVSLDFPKCFFPLKRNSLVFTYIQPSVAPISAKAKLLDKSPSFFIPKLPKAIFEDGKGNVDELLATTPQKQSKSSLLLFSGGQLKSQKGKYHKIMNRLAPVTLPEKEPDTNNVDSLTVSTTFGAESNQCGVPVDTEKGHSPTASYSGWVQGGWGDSTENLQSIEGLDPKSVFNSQGIDSADYHETGLL